MVESWCEAVPGRVEKGAESRCGHFGGPQPTCEFYANTVETLSSPQDDPKLQEVRKAQEEANSHPPTPTYTRTHYLSLTLSHTRSHPHIRTDSLMTYTCHIKESAPGQRRLVLVETRPQNIDVVDFDAPSKPLSPAFRRLWQGTTRPKGP